MSIDDTLRQVEADLEQGRIFAAVNGLQGLVRERPERLDVRLRLAEIYRGQGERAQAGRWSFLSEDADPAELTAFERQFRTASGRLSAVAWPGGTDELGPKAAERLTALRQEAAQEIPVPVVVREETVGDKVAAALGCTAAVVVAVIALIGLGALIMQGARIVIGWL
jgi:hypothetical protein